MAVSHSLLWPARKGAFPPESPPTSHTFTQGERHPAHWNQFPIGTASYCRSVPQSIEFKGYTHPIYFPQEWNPHFHCFFFSWEEKWPLIAEKYTSCTITAEESSPHCLKRCVSSNLLLLLLLESWDAPFYSAYTNCLQLLQMLTAANVHYISFYSRERCLSSQEPLNVLHQEMPQFSMYL